MQMLKDSECKSKFDFDIHAVRQVKDILAVAIGMLKPHSLKLDFEMNMATMVKFANAGKNFTAKDMLISLDSTIKVPAESAALYARRTDHYGSANRWHRAALNVLLSLNAISEVTRGEYQFNDNSLANGLKAAFAE
jgi:hypothetical protein